MTSPYLDKPLRTLDEVRAAAALDADPSVLRWEVRGTRYGHCLFIMRASDAAWHETTVATPKRDCAEARAHCLQRYAAEHIDGDAS